MPLKLTPDILAGAYDFLRTTRPFAAWRLPESDEVSFVVSRNIDRMGCFWSTGENMHIELSERCIGHTDTLLRTMAHEMIHLAQYSHGTETRDVMHNSDFKKKARRVCRAHGWDPHLFA